MISRLGRDSPRGAGSQKFVRHECVTSVVKNGVESEVLLLDDGDGISLAGFDDRPRVFDGRRSVLDGFLPRDGRGMIRGVGNQLLFGRDLKEEEENG